MSNSTRRSLPSRIGCRGSSKTTASLSKKYKGFKDHNTPRSSPLILRLKHNPPPSNPRQKKRANKPIFTKIKNQKNLQLLKTSANLMNNHSPGLFYQAFILINKLIVKRMILLKSRWIKLYKENSGKKL